MTKEQLDHLLNFPQPPNLWDADTIAHFEKKAYARKMIEQYREQIIALINYYESGMSSEFIIGKIKNQEINLS